MAALSHVKSDTIGDFTGTVTVFNSQGSTATVAATDLVRPSDWNSAHNFFQTISGNTGGDASTASGTNLVVGGTNGAAVALSTAAGAATLWISNQPASFWQPLNAGAEMVVGQQGNASLHFQPVMANNGAVFDRIVVPVNWTGATNSTASATMSMWFGFYTRNGSSLSLYGSGSGSWAVTHSGTANSTINSGLRIVSAGWTSTIPSGQYWLGIVSRTTSGGANATWNQVLASQPNSNWSGYLGSATNATYQPILGQGHYSATTSGIPSSVAFSQITGSASIAFRPPVVLFMSQSA